MNKITNFEPSLAASLPETFELLTAANLVVHPAVTRIILHGSRSLAGGFRPSSDIDLSLIIDTLPQLAGTELDAFLFDAMETTRSQWSSGIELDLAVVFETRNCALACFDETEWNNQLCKAGGVDCFGLYKAGRGFNGLVTNAGVQVKLMYPCIKVWQKA